VQTYYTTGNTKLKLASPEALFVGGHTFQLATFNIAGLLSFREE
jgi:hypothetical protein